MPRPTPAPITSVTRSRVSDPNWSGRTRKKSAMNALSGSATASRITSVRTRPEEADERALEHERPADERVRCADEAHDLDLLGAGEDREADRVDDDEQGDDADDDQDDGPGRAQDAGDRQDPFDEVLDVDDVADARVAAQRITDDAHLRRVDHLDLDARVQRVVVEVAGQVLAALGRHRFAKADERLVAADVGDRRDLGHRLELRLELGDLRVGGVGLEVGDDLDLLLGELEAGEQAGLDDPEAGQQEEHQDHRGRRGQAHDGVPPEALPGAGHAEQDERDHR